MNKPNPFVFLSRSYASLRDVELLAVVDAAPGLPPFVAGAVVVRGKNPQGFVATEALAADVLDAEPLQQLRDLLAKRSDGPVRINLVAQGCGSRSSSMAWTLRGFRWSHPKHLQNGGGAPDTLAIEAFLARVMRPYMQAEAAL